MTEHANQTPRRRSPLLQNGPAIRRRRHEAGLLLRATAALAEISPGYLSQIETAKQGVRPPVLARIASVLGCTTADLLADPPPPSESR